MRSIRSRTGALACAAILCGAVYGQATTEERNSPGVYQIKAADPSATGLGTTAAILDTGIMGLYADGVFSSGHPEFGLGVLPGFNALDGSADVTDGSGHGTHVAGILAAHRNNPSSRGMFGPAFDAHLLPVKVLGDDDWGSNATIAAGVRFAVRQKTAGAVAESHRPSVINLSLGSPASSNDVVGALKQAVSAGMVVVVAAGNHAEANPDYPARHAKEGWANGQIIAVGAVDAEDRLATFANRAGDTAAFYLVAPGVDVYSTFPRGGRAGYASMSGTSMAAPYVTAGVVLIKSAWPYLGAGQITDILLTSAKDLGDPGVDATYGRGLIDLAAALSPIGTLNAPASSGSLLPVEHSSIHPSAVTGSALRSAARAGQFRLAAFDRYGRDFQIDLAPAVRRGRAAKNGLSAMFAALDAHGSVRQDQAGNTWRFGQQSDVARLALGEPGGSEPVSGSAIDPRGYEVAFGSGGAGGQAFGLAGELTRVDGSAFMPQLANPFFSLAPRHSYVAAGLPLTEHLRLKLGTVFTDSAALPHAQEPQLADRSQKMALAELTAQSGPTLWSLSLGRLQEDQSLLGSTYAGAMDWGTDAGTTVVTVGAAREIGSRMTIGAQYSAGFTGAAGNEADSLVTGATELRSDSYTLFASLSDTFHRDDRLSLTFSQPLRSVSGALEMEVPVRAAADGSPVVEQRAISLKPEGRELRADLFYLAPLARQTTWFLGGTLRHQPEHDPALRTEKFVGTGLRKLF